MSWFSQDMLFDIIIFLISPVNTMMILAVMFMPAHPSFSLCYKNKRLDCSSFRNFHDDSSINGISVCKSVLAVDGIIFNWEIFYCHVPKRKSPHSKKKVKPFAPCTGALYCLYRRSSMQILLNLFFVYHTTPTGVRQPKWKKLSVLQKFKLKMKNSSLNCNWMVKR